MILVFLFVLSTISFAESVCVEKLPDTKNYAVFRSGEEYRIAQCSYKDGRYMCCADMDLNNILRVFFITTDGKQVEKIYQVIEGNKWVKTLSDSTVTITVYGEDGTYLVVERIPKEFVESAEDIESDEMIIMEFDPVVAWFVGVENGVGYVSYRVRRGSLPPTSPEIRLSECLLDINTISTKQITEGGTTYVILTFEVLLDGERVIPSNIKTYVDGERVEVRYLRDSKTFEIIYPTEKDKIRVDIEARSGECKERYSTTILVEKRYNYSTYLIILLTVVVLVLLWLYVRRGS